MAFRQNDGRVMCLHTHAHAQRKQKTFIKASRGVVGGEEENYHVTSTYHILCGH